MGTVNISLMVFVCVFGASLFGMLLRRALPEHHLNSETRDTVKLAMGFVATMAALILGLLVASAKDAYDKQSTSVTQMAAKVIYLDRLLANFGPESKEIREQLRRAVEQVTIQMWPETRLGESQLDPSVLRSEELLSAIRSLRPANDLQTSLKAQAVSMTLELGQMRWQVYEQSTTTASMPMIYGLVFWMVVLFVSFGLFAPSNGTVVASLMVAAFSIAGAILLILELRSPFKGLMQISNAPFLDALSHLGR